MNKHNMDLKKNSRKTIAFFNTTYVTIVLKQWPGILNACEEFDVNLIFLSGSLIRRAISSIPTYVMFDYIQPEQVDGILCYSSTLFYEVGIEKRNEFLNRYKSVPIVSQGIILDGYPSYVMDNYQGVYQAMCHLITDHGKRRIAFSRGPTFHAYAEERFRAYKDALAAHGIPPDPNLITEPHGWENEEGRNSIKQLLDERKQKPVIDFEAVVAVNDRQAIGIINELQERRIRIPQDIAVIGFNDDPETQFLTPPLTTVRAPFYELGEYGIRLVMEMINGRPVSMLNKIPVKLKIRQSCGCFSPAVIQAAAGISTVVSEKKMITLLKAEYQSLIKEMTREIHAESAADWMKMFLEAFYAELTQKNPGCLLSALNDIIQKTIKSGIKVEKLHNVLSVFRRRIIPYLGGSEEMYIAESLLQQARIEIGEAVWRVQGLNDLQNTKYKEKLREVTDKLITTFDVLELMDILFEELPGLGISVFYLSIYEESHKYSEWSRLILAYNKKGRINLGPEGQRIRSTQILPEYILPDRQRSALTMLPIHFREEQIGFIYASAELDNSAIYDNLRRGISNALFGAMLIKRVQKNAAEITRQKYILDTFMETIPERIYFKDLDGHIIRCNNAYAMRMGLKNTNDVIGKTDFDFFTEEEASTKYNHEKKIINTGKPLIALEEKTIKQDGTEDWFLTTKMPLRNENREIIGTFGISHDITELKQTQNSLENANLEIIELNEKLKDENIKMHTEMGLAQQIQTSLLPENTENFHPDFKITAKMLPAESVGGDYYDISLDRSGNLWIGIGDVSGHGVTPGLIMMMAQTVHTSITTNYDTSPAEMVSMINRVLIKNVQGRLKNDHIMTFSTLKYQGDGIFQYAGAHLDMLVYRKEKKKFDLIPTAGTWLNLLPEITDISENNNFSLDIGDILILYTDGIIEAVNHKNELLEMCGFTRIIQKHINKEVTAMRDDILNDLLNWCGGKQWDDITILIVKRIKKGFSPALDQGD